MRNDTRKKSAVVLLDADGNPDSQEYQIVHEGKAGVRVSGLVRVLWFADEGKTWMRTEVR